MGDWCQGILGLDSGGSDDERVSAEEEEKWGRKAVMFDPPETPRATCRLSLPVNTNKMGSADKLCYRDEWYLFRHTEIRVDFVFWWILSKQSSLHWGAAFIANIQFVVSLPAMKVYLMRKPRPSSSSSLMNLIHMNRPVDVTRPGFFPPQKRSMSGENPNGPSRISMWSKRHSNDGSM